MSVRVRFAPSPTGYLHIGGARTALFNWLFARNKGGKFILRIEDTDTARNREEFTSAIIRDLKWLGLDWDEGPNVGGDFGPYFQSERLESYKKSIEELKEKGFIYECFCSSEELTERRNLAMKEHRTPGYDGRCRTLKQEEKEKYLKEGRRPALRFLVPNEGFTKFNDIVRGEVSFENKLLADFIVQKSDGMASFMFANSVDDVLMDITHVIRGDDHLSNTPRQILITRALGKKEPIYAHVPMIFGKSGSPLSKRDGAVAVDWYRDNGFLPEALRNYLVLLGWAPDGVRQVIDVKDMINEFTLERISKNPGIFDMDKLTWMNSEYLKKSDPKITTDLVIEYLISKNLLKKENISVEEKNRIEKIIGIIGDRFKTIPDIEMYGSFFFQDRIEYDPADLNGKLINDIVKKALKLLKEKFASSLFDHLGIEETVRSTAQELGLKPKDIIHPLRYVVTGKTVGPGLFETLEIIGRETVIKRLGIVK